MLPLLMSTLFGLNASLLFKPFALILPRLLCGAISGRLGVAGSSMGACFTGRFFKAWMVQPPSLSDM